MVLKDAHVTNYRSTDDSTSIPIDPEITAFVGLNESGKTSILQAIHATMGQQGVKLSLERDFPRKRLAEHNRKTPRPRVPAVKLTFKLSAGEMDSLADEFGKGAVTSPEFAITGSYEHDGYSFDARYDEKAAIAHIANAAPGTPGFKEAVQGAADVREAIERLRALPLDANGIAARDKIIARFKPNETKGDLFWLALWSAISRRIPRTFYFDDYSLLPAKVNLRDLQNRKNAGTLEEKHETILALLDVAGVSIEELQTPTGFESARARLESISANISDRIFQFWKQNDNIDVEFHVSDDANDSPPYNQGKNLYVRIKNNRHRVTMPLSNRSKGFIWFFSFLIWFDKIQNTPGSSPILLLDEPGLNLHALAQRDFLAYIEHLAESHQVLYTTHSPFMVESGKLHRVRVVEDKLKEGTQVSSNVSGSSPNTLFPLQAALGYTVAQNLFIRTRNLLVEGPADLILLRFFSSNLEQAGRTGLREDVAITPAGGSAKIATFVALLNANDLELVSLIDYAGKDDEHLKDLVRRKILSDKLALHYGQFRAGSRTAIPTDVEDLLPVAAYLNAFNSTYKKQLPSPVEESDLPKGDRIVERLTRHLEAKHITLRPSGGYNHFAVIQSLVTNRTFKPDAATLAIFEALFLKVNSLFALP